ncbi:MAG: c-type cytochrome [Myxococcales bacterium]|nr:c-type cytochrome [Myxococcales bacterium]
MTAWVFGAAALVGSGAAHGGCGGGEDLPASAVNEAKEIFAVRCAPCHGTSGKGDGPGAAALDPKPRDYTSAEWQKSVTDEQIEKIILGGGPAVGKSSTMPPNPDLDKKRAVVKALRAQVRGFAKK